MEEVRKGFSCIYAYDLIPLMDNVSFDDIKSFVIYTGDVMPILMKQVTIFCQHVDNPFNNFPLLSQYACHWFLDIINNHKNDEIFGKKLFNFWTGSEYIDPNALSLIFFETNGTQSIKSHTCFQRIDLFYWENMNEYEWKKNALFSIQETGDSFAIE